MRDACLLEAMVDLTALLAAVVATWEARLDSPVTARAPAVEARSLHTCHPVMRYPRQGTLHPQAALIVRSILDLLWVRAQDQRAYLAVMEP